PTVTPIYLGYERRILQQRPDRVTQVRSSVEHAGAKANCPLARASRIPCNAQSRRDEIVMVFPERPPYVDPSQIRSPASDALARQLQFFGENHPVERTISQFGIVERE